MCAFTETKLIADEKSAEGSSIKSWQDVAIGNSPLRILDLMSCLKKSKQGHSNNVRLVEGTAATNCGWA